MEKKVCDEIQLQKQNRLNQLANEYLEESVDERRFILRQKIIEAFLVINLRIKEIWERDEDELACQMTAKLNETNHNEEKGFLNKHHVDTEVLIKAVDYALENYSPEKGEFFRLLVRTNSLRQKGYRNDVNSQRHNKGFILSKREQQLIRDVNNIIEVLARENKEFIGKKVFDLTKDELKKVLDHGVLNKKQEEKITELSKINYNIQTSISIEAVGEQLLGDDDAISSTGNDIANNMVVDRDIQMEAAMENVFADVFKNATNNQKRYYSCFVVQDMYNSNTLEMLSAMEAYSDRAFLQWIMERQENKRQTIIDGVIAEYLQVQKAAVSKQRKNYELATRQVYTRDR